KELAEGKPQQREDDGDRVQDGEKIVAVAFHPRVARGQEQAGDADREEQNQRQEILDEELHRGGAFFAHAPADGQHDAGNHQKRRPHQAVKNYEAGGRFGVEDKSRKAEKKDAVFIRRGGKRLEMNPAENQREGDRGREDAAPHDQPVGEPALAASSKNKPVHGDVAENAATPVERV